MPPTIERLDASDTARLKQARRRSTLSPNDLRAPRRADVCVTGAGALRRRAVAHPVLLRPTVRGPAPPTPVPPSRCLHVVPRLDAIALPPRGRRRLRATPPVEPHPRLKARPRPPDAASSRARLRGQPAKAAARQRCGLSLRRHRVCQAKGRADGPSRQLGTALAGELPSPRLGHAPSAACCLGEGSRRISRLLSMNAGLLRRSALVPARQARRRLKRDGEPCAPVPQHRGRRRRRRRQARRDRAEIVPRLCRHSSPSAPTTESS